MLQRKFRGSVFIRNLLALDGIMATLRIEELHRKLDRGKALVVRTFSKLQAGDWEKPASGSAGSWTLRELLAHFASAEATLLGLCKDVAGGGRGAPENFNYDEFNRNEQEAMRGQSPEELLRLFGRSRDSLLEWILGLSEDQLDRKGRHPALGEVTLEDMLSAVHGHVLLHLRELP